MSEVTLWTGKTAGVPRFGPIKTTSYSGRRGWWLLDRATGDIIGWYRTWEEAHARAELLIAEHQS